MVVRLKAKQIYSHSIQGQENMKLSLASIDLAGIHIPRNKTMWKMLNLQMRQILQIWRLQKN